LWAAALITAACLHVFVWLSLYFAVRSLLEAVQPARESFRSAAWTALGSSLFGLAAGVFIATTLDESVFEMFRVPIIGLFLAGLVLALVAGAVFLSKLRDPELKREWEELFVAD
jgi:hypothetical protein